MTNAHSIEQLRNLNPWAEIPDEIWPEMLCHLSVRTVPIHHILFHQSEHGQAVYVVVSGLLKLVKTDEKGKNTVLYLGQPGDLLGEQLLGDEGCYACWAQTLEDCCVVAIEADWVKAAAHQHPHFGWALFRLLLHRLQQAEARWSKYRFNLTEQRIGVFLKEIAHYHGRTLLNGEIELRLPLTHELIGEMVSVSRQQVTVVFNRWADAGIIRYTRKRIVLTRPELL